MNKNPFEQVELRLKSRTKRIECIALTKANPKRKCGFYLMLVVFHFSNDDFHSFQPTKITCMEAFACTLNYTQKSTGFAKRFPIGFNCCANRGWNAIKKHKCVYRYKLRCNCNISRDQNRKRERKRENYGKIVSMYLYNVDVMW